LIDIEHTFFKEPSIINNLFHSTSNVICRTFCDEKLGTICVDNVTTPNVNPPISLPTYAKLNRRQHLPTLPCYLISDIALQPWIIITVEWRSLLLFVLKTVDFVVVTTCVRCRLLLK